MADHNDFGREAEELAADYLTKLGYQILAKNYRYLKAEIDIIAEFENLLIIVEVKARKTDLFIEPHAAVNRKKIKLLVSAADFYVQQNKVDKDVRFDIISIVPGPEGVLEIVHFPGAFESIDSE